MIRRVYLILTLSLIALPLFGQSENLTEPASATNDVSSMLTPPTVSGQSYPTITGSEMHANYLRYGMSVTSAYSDNMIGTTVGSPPISEMSYSIAPTVSFDQTTSTLHSIVTYSPGFTLYQKTSSRDEADQNLSLSFEDRLSPHVVLNARDTLQKSSSVFNQADFGSDPVSGGAQGPNNSAIAPFADLLRNAGNVGATYQFAANGMVGASGTFTNLYYENSTQVAGLSDSTSQAGSAFFSLRASALHYFGVNYQYQRLISSTADGPSETQTHGIFFYYTIYPKAGASISFFAGPQYADTTQPAIAGLTLPPSRSWNPALGGSANWQANLTNIAVSYSHVISGGGGLSQAVHMQNASLSFRQQITKTFTATMGGAYTDNKMIGTSFLGGTNENGHTISSTFSVQKQVGDHLNFQVGYSRLYQDYNGVAVFAANPTTNREFVTLSYQFSKPLGR